MQRDLPWYVAEFDDEASISLKQTRKENLLKYFIITQNLIHNKPYKEIEEQLQISNIGKGTISKWIRRFLEDGSCESSHFSNCGRKKKIKTKEKKIIVNCLKNDKTNSAEKLSQEVKKYTKKDISASTVLRLENEIGSFKFAIPKPLLSTQNMEKRKEFCKKYMELHETFKSVLFTDES